ncbi:MFS transporter [Holospora obtusa]|nr:MFS transporter [Holospora obtusa]
METVKHFNWIKACLKLFIPLLFFGYQFILRRWPGLMMETMMKQFSVNATEFGMLASMYYYGYAGMQLPIAFLCGRLEMRVVLCFCALLCSIGLSILTYTHHVYLAMIAQFFIGSGSAAGFLCAAEAISLWFPKERYGQVMGVSVAFGLLGAIYGGQPVRSLLDLYPWQFVAFGIVGVGCLISFSALWLPSSAKHHSVEASGGFCDIFKNPILIFLGIANLLMVGVLEGFADVWAGPFLVQNYGLSASHSAGIASWIFKGMMIGSPIVAFLAKYFGNYAVIVACGISMSGAFLLLLFSSVPLWSLPLLFVILGIGCCYQILIFVAARDWCPAHKIGAGLAFLNTLNMLGGAFFHPIIGFFVDHLNNKISLKLTYTYALSIIPLCGIVGMIMVFCVGWYYRRKIVHNKTCI